MVFFASNPQGLYLLAVTQGGKCLPSGLLCSVVVTVPTSSEKPPVVAGLPQFPSPLTYSGRLPTLAFIAYFTPCVAVSIYMATVLSYFICT